jgi:hypothetical protein
VNEKAQLPEELELMAAGPALAAVLASVDREALSGKDRVRLLRARHRLAAHLQGELYADMYAVSRADPAEQPGVVRPDEPEEPYPWAATEIAFALRWTHTAASVRLDQAVRMVEDLPMVQAALAAGAIDVPKALVMLDEVCSLEPEVARRIVARLVVRAPELTTGQLRAKLRRLVLAADPQGAARRARTQVKSRCVVISQDHHRLASISGYDLLPHRVAAGYERLTAIARAAKAAGDPRRMDELRADAMMDLLIGDGVAVGSSITYGGLDEPPPDRNRDQKTGQEVDRPCQDQPKASTVRPEIGQDRSGTGGERAEDAAVSTPPTAGPAPVPDRDIPISLDEDVPWPDAPANRDLLDEDDPAVDWEHERLRPYWLAGFDWLATARPDACPRCRRPSPDPVHGPMPAPRRGTIDLQMSLTTLMGLDDLPAELSGFGPLLADIARQVAQERPDLQLRYSVHDRLDDLIAHGVTTVRPRARGGPDGRRTKRRPTAEVAALVRARNRTCAAPGCRIPSLRCELDHILAWADHGETEPDNLDPACTRHHTFKHAPGTQLVAFSPGTFGWQTPLGMQYLSKPDPPLYDDHRYIHPPQPGDI